MASGRNLPEEAGQVKEPDPMDAGIANSSSGKDAMDWECSSTAEQPAVPVSHDHRSREQNRSEELTNLSRHLDMMANFMGKVRTRTRSFQESNGTMDIFKLFEDIDKLLGEGAALKDNIYRLWVPPDDTTAEPTNRASGTRINPRPETQTFPPQNNSNTEQGASGQEQSNSEHSFTNSDESSTVLALPQASNESNPMQETELDTLQRRGEFVSNVTSFVSFNNSMPQQEDSSSSQSAAQNHGHQTSHTSDQINPSPTGVPAYQDAPYIYRRIEDLSFAADSQGMYVEEPSATAAAATPTGQPTPAGNQGIQLRPSLFTSPSIPGPFSQGSLQNWTKSPWGMLPFWDVKNTRYDKGTSFKVAQELHSFSRSVGVIVKNDLLWGTCARYGQWHVMTCEHVARPVFANLVGPSNAFVEFNYYDEWPPQSPVRLDIQGIEYSCQRSSLDFCLLRLNIPDSIFHEFQRRSPGLGPQVMLPGRKVERVTLVGHHLYCRKRFDYNCPVLDWYQSAQYAGQPSSLEDSAMFHADRINYRSTFRVGGSGSPVVAIFDDKIHVVAMHTQGYPTGQTCEVEQGVKMSAIRADLKANDPRLYHELFH